ncbi:trans-acting t-cell-specific transcription factor gata-3 isoform x6, partial [Lasius niger]
FKIVVKECEVTTNIDRLKPAYIHEKDAGIDQSTSTPKPTSSNQSNEKETMADQPPLTSSHSSNEKEESEHPILPGTVPSTVSPPFPPKNKIVTTRSGRRVRFNPKYA